MQSNRIRKENIHCFYKVFTTPLDFCVYYFTTLNHCDVMTVMNLKISIQTSRNISKLATDIKKQK